MLYDYENVHGFTNGGFGQQALRCVYIDHHEVDELALGRQESACTCILQIPCPGVPFRQRSNACSLVNNTEDPAPIQHAQFWVCCLTEIQ
jgi:hypothetical protein